MYELMRGLCRPPANFCRTCWPRILLTRSSNACVPVAPVGSCDVSFAKQHTFCLDHRLNDATLPVLSESSELPAPPRGIELRDAPAQQRLTALDAMCSCRNPRLRFEKFFEGSDKGNSGITRHGSPLDSNSQGTVSIVYGGGFRFVHCTPR